MAFYARMAKIGAVVLGEYRNARTRVLAICPEGHECYASPHALQKGRGICVICGGKDPATVEATFRQRLAELEATPLFNEYRGTEQKYHVLCAAGHHCYPTAHAVQSGDGFCRPCARMAYDAFYVVSGAGIVKFGISAQDARRRLQSHARDGYGNVVRLFTGLPGSAALDAENAVKAALADAGQKPVKGQEYFAESCLALILDVADPRLSVPAA